MRGDFRIDLRARALYSEGAGIYRILPEGVAFPVDESDLVTLLEWAGEHRVPLTPRGAGSSVTGSNVGAGVILELTRMEPRTLEVYPESSTARTSAGVRWGELNLLAGQHGLRLPPDPSSGPFATLGGMVSTNASGARSVRFGSMRRWVLGLSIITGTGTRETLRRGTRTYLDYPRKELLENEALIRARFPQVTKNSAGYALDAWLDSGDAIDLLIGAEGTLGIITEIDWSLAPIPSHRAGLRICLGRLEHLTEAVEALLPLAPSSLELMDRTFLDLVRAGPAGEVAPAGTESVLLLEFEGDERETLRGTVGDAVRLMKNLALDIETALQPEEEEKLWRLRHAASPIIADLPEGRRSLQVIEDACVPVPRMGEYIASVRDLAQRVGIPVVIFGHAGDGNIHVNLLPETDRPGWEAGVSRLHDEITDTVIRLGGTTSGEHGDGRIRAPVLPRLYGEGVMELFRRIKQAFDPLGILNPGVKLLERTGGHLDRRTENPLRDLKVGSSAAEIPEDIAQELRDIERRGDYLRDRLVRETDH
jgi:FAD/FMN-containing dehydrogenase